MYKKKSNLFPVYVSDSIKEKLKTIKAREKRTFKAITEIAIENYYTTIERRNK